MLEMWTYRTTVVLSPPSISPVSRSRRATAASGRSTSRPPMPARATSWWTPAPGSSVGRCILPAQTMRAIDLDDRDVSVDRTKDEIKNAPEFDPERGIDPMYQDELGGYYGRYYC